MENVQNRYIPPKDVISLIPIRGEKSTRLIKFLFQLSVLIGLLVLMLSGCGSVIPKAAVVQKEKEKVAAKTEITVRREIGSLWSNDSRWNEIYSEVSSRAVGDIIKVNLTDGFRSKLAARVEKLIPKKEPVKEEKKDDKSPPKPVAEAAPIEGSAPKPAADAKVLHLQIKEVLPRGQYILAGQESLRMMDAEPIIIVEARVRDKDIEGDDTVSADAFLNLKLDATLKKEEGVKN